MREIKYKVWNRPQKRMMEWEEVGRCYFDDVESMAGIFDFLQYTGLKDKNGKEIYEGDIIQHPRFYETPEMSNNPPETGYIILKDGAFRFNDGESLLYDELNSYDGDMEVIGNIYENPSLLK